MNIKFTAVSFCCTTNSVLLSSPAHILSNFDDTICLNIPFYEIKIQDFLKFSFIFFSPRFSANKGKNYLVFSNDFLHFKRIFIRITKRFPTRFECISARMIQLQRLVAYKKLC